MPTDNPPYSNRICRGRSPRVAPLLVAALIAIAAFASACGSEEESADSASVPEPAASGADLDAIKGYLTDHTVELTEHTAELKAVAEEYYALAEAVDFDYDRLLDEDRKEVAELLERGQDAFRAANPAYEEMEGVVAGVPSLADYDVIIDAGSTGEDPENAVPFDLRLPDGRIVEQPGNFFFITETSLFGTNEEFLADAEGDVDGDGKVEFGEGLPEANLFVAAMRDFDGYARELDADAQAFQPTESDAFTALVVMTPTMSEYFDAWKSSRFVAEEDKATPEFAAASRLEDIADILGGLVVVYDEIEPMIAETDPEQARQTGRSLVQLEEYAADLRDREAGGERFEPEQAETLGAEAQERAEAIAGQVSQAAAELDIEVEEG